MSCGFHSVRSLMDKDKSLMEASWWERLTGGETGSCSDGWGHAQQICNPIFCWWAGLCSLPVVWPETNYGGGNEDNDDLLQKVPCTHCHTQCPPPCSRPLLTHASAGDSWTHRQVWVSVCGVPAPFSHVLVTQGFFCALQESVSPVLCKFCNQIPLASKIKFPGVSQSLCQIPGLGNLLWVLELS